MHSGFAAIRQTLGFNVGVRIALGDEAFAGEEGAALRETGREAVHERESVEGRGKRLVADLRAT
jgi:hypothetical protein